MGSLMAGWNSPVFTDPDTAMLERNKSLTKEEIDVFWRLQGKFGYEDHEPLSPTSVIEKYSGSNISAPTPLVSLVDVKIGDWWMKSSWAFLNEPPRDKMGDSAHKYTSQFDVAEIAKK